MKLQPEWMCFTFFLFLYFSLMYFIPIAVPLPPLLPVLPLPLFLPRSTFSLFSSGKEQASKRYQLNTVYQVTIRRDTNLLLRLHEVTKQEEKPSQKQIKESETPLAPHPLVVFPKNAKLHNHTMQSRHFKSRFDLEDCVPVLAVTSTRLGKQFHLTEPSFFPCVQRAGILTLLSIRMSGPLAHIT